MSVTNQSERASDPNPVLWLATSAGKTKRYCSLGIPRFVPAITFRQFQAGVRKFSVTFERIFCDLSVGMEVVNENTETRPHFYI